MSITTGDIFLNSSWLYSLTNSYTGSDGFFNYDPASASMYGFSISQTSPTLYQFCPTQNPEKYNICTMVTGTKMCLDIVTDQTRVPHLAPPAVVLGQDWTITNWGDGTYMMVNDYSGPDLHLDVFADTKAGQLDTGNHSGQHWSFHPISKAAPNQICIAQPAPSPPSNQQSQSFTTPITSTTKAPSTTTGSESDTPIAYAQTARPQTSTSTTSVQSSQTQQTGVVGAPSAPSPPNSSGSSVQNMAPLAAPSVSGVLSTGAYVGIAVGVAIPLATLLIVIVWFLRRHRRRDEQNSESGTPPSRFNTMSGYYGRRSMYSSQDPFSDPVSAVEEIVPHPFRTYSEKGRSPLDSHPAFRSAPLPALPTEDSPVETEGRMIYKQKEPVELPGQEWI